MGGDGKMQIFVPERKGKHENRIKACPFCGRVPIVDDCGDNRFFVRCKCGIAQDKLYWQRCDAVRQWNTRRQQPEIIACGDCKHYEFTDNRAFGFPAKLCEWSGFEDMDDDDFCSRGERKENAAD